MFRKHLFLLISLLAPLAPAQSLQEAITAADRAVTTPTTLHGSWLLELRRPEAPATIPLVVTYLPDGAAVGVSSSDGTQSGQVGVWAHVAEHRFVQTMYVFTFNESRAFAGMTKIRINLLLSEDGRTASGTTEVVILDREAKVVNTIPGTTFTATRLVAERPGDFDTFGH